MENPKTRRALIDQVLDNLGILVLGQDPSASNVAKVDNILDPVLAQLSAEGIVYVADGGTAAPPYGGEIPLELFLPLANCVAWECAGKFNLAGDQSLKTLDILARETLRQIGRPAEARRTLRVDPQLRGRIRRGAGNYSRGT